MKKHLRLKISIFFSCLSLLLLCILIPKNNKVYAREIISVDTSTEPQPLISSNLWNFEYPPSNSIPNINVSVPYKNVISILGDFSENVALTTSTYSINPYLTRYNGVESFAVYHFIPIFYLSSGFDNFTDVTLFRVTLYSRTFNADNTDVPFTMKFNTDVISSTSRWTSNYATSFMGWRQNYIFWSRDYLDRFDKISTDASKPQYYEFYYEITFFTSTSWGSTNNYSFVFDNYIANSQISIRPPLLPTFNSRSSTDISSTSAYQEGYTAGVNSLQSELLNQYNSGYSNGYTAGETGGYEKGYQEGNTAGVTSGYSNGFTAGETQGYQQGYQEGLSVEGVDNMLGNAMITVVELPWKMIKQILNFEVLGINFASLFLGLFTLVIVFWLLRHFS